MGYKDLFVDYSSMDKSEIKIYEEKRLALLKQKSPELYKREIEKKAKVHRLPKLKYKKVLSPSDKTIFAERLNKSPFAQFHRANVMLRNVNLNITLNNYLDAVPRLMKVDIRKILNLKIKINENFSCGLIRGNIASINYDKEENWRYFTRDERYTEGYVLGIIDIIQIIFGYNQFQAINLLCGFTSIKVKQAEWGKKQCIKYYQNLGIIKRAQQMIGEQYPILYKYIKRHLYVLDALNNQGLLSITSEEMSFEGNGVFFTSSRYIEKYLKTVGINKSYTNINKLINMFTAIGLVNKIPLNNLSLKLQEETKKYLNIKSTQVVKNYEVDKKHCHPISFYQIPRLTANVLYEAERRVKLLKERKIKATGVIITNNAVKTALGDTVYNSLFLNRLSFIKGIERAKTKQRKLVLENKKDQH
ncbi:hypothetical protein ACFQPF_03615 [Fictibacillus iocasae]|uniref:Uncharacterized protein n=1 Tax=Fictibacillus iocasae TaxID=2715437 RepID=A0ABW2NJA5_9BACL